MENAKTENNTSYQVDRDELTNINAVLRHCELQSRAGVCGSNKTGNWVIHWDIQADRFELKMTLI